MPPRPAASTIPTARPRGVAARPRYQIATRLAHAWNPGCGDLDAVRARRRGSWTGRRVLDRLPEDGRERLQPPAPDGLRTHRIEPRGSTRAAAAFHVTGAVQCRRCRERAARARDAAAADNSSPGDVVRGLGRDQPNTPADIRLPRQHRPAVRAAGPVGRLPARRTRRRSARGDVSGDSRERETSSRHPHPGRDHALHRTSKASATICPRVARGDFTAVGPRHRRPALSDPPPRYRLLRHPRPGLGAATHRVLDPHCHRLPGSCSTLARSSLSQCAPSGQPSSCGTDGTSPSSPSA